MKKLGLLKRRIALLLTACMLLSLLPTAALEEGEPGGGTIVVTIENDSTAYSTLSAAWAAATTENTDGSPVTVKLLADVSSEGCGYTGEYNNTYEGTLLVSEGQTITVDLNGFTLQYYGRYDALFHVYGTLRLTDSTAPWRVEYEANPDTYTSGRICSVSGSEGGYISVLNKGKFFMDSGKISGLESQFNAGIAVNAGTDCTFEMSGGLIENNTSYAYGSTVYLGGPSTISGGVIRNNVTSGYDTGEDARYPYYCVVIGPTASLSMTGGAIIGNKTSCQEAMGSAVYQVTHNPGASSFTVSNGATITGNVQLPDTRNNVGLANDTFITVGGPLTGTIGVTTETAPTKGHPVIIAKPGIGYTISQSDLDCFVSDNSAYLVRLNSAGQVELTVDVANVSTEEELAAALADEAVSSINVTGNVSYTGDISRPVDIAIAAGGTLTYHYYTEAEPSKKSTESLANFTVKDGGKLVFFGDGLNNQYRTPHLIYRGDLTVKSGGTVEADQNGSGNGILLVYGDICNSGSITVKALENINTPGGLYHAIDAAYSGTAVTGSYKRNLCRTLPVAVYPIVSVIGATGGTGPNATPMEGDTLYGTVDGYGETDAATPAGMFTFRWLLDDVPQGTGSSYTVPLSAVGKVCSVELYEIGSDYVFFGVDERVVTGYIKNNARVDLGTVSVKTSELLYLGGDTASDTNDGSTPEKALATANAAIARAANGGTIVVCGDTMVPAQQTRIEGKSLTFTNTDSTTTYPNPALSMNRPYFDSDVTLQGVTWKQAGGSSYCSTGKNITLTLNAITPENISYIQGKAGSRLVVRDSTLTGIISGLLEFDSIELDRSAATALFNSGLPNDASDFILKNGSTLSVSKDIKTLTSVGEGNTIQARKTVTTDGKPAPAPVSVLCAVKIDSGKPIALTSYFKGTPKDGTPYLTGTDETFTLENFTLDSDRFALVKYENTLYAAARPVALAPTGIASDSATMCATATAIPATAAEFLWWKVGDEGNKATASISDTTSFSATLSGLLPGTAYAYQVRTQIGKTWLESAPVTFRTLIEQATPPTGSISGSVTNNTGVTCNITVTIEEGNTICATQVLSGVSNTTASTFSFSALSDGFYNVVADNGAYKVTRLVEIKDGGAALNVALALGKTQSVVEILTPDTPPAAVNGLPEQFEETVTDEDKGYTAANE